MAFCGNCGKELKDGEVCSCQTPEQAVPVDLKPEDKVQETASDTAKEEVKEAAGADTNTEASKSEASAANAEGGLSNERPDYKAMANNVAGAVSGGAKKFAGSVKDAVGKGGESLKDFSSKKNIPFKGLVGGIIGVVALIVIIIVAVSVIGGKGYEGPIEDICETLTDSETDMTKIADALLPDFVYDAFEDAYKIIKKSDDFDDVNDEFKELLENAYDGLEDDYGKNVKITYDIKSAEKIDKDDLKDMEDAFKDLYESVLEDLIEDIEDLDSDDWEDLADELEISKSDAKKLGDIAIDLMKEFKKPSVSAGYEVELRLKVEGKDESSKSDRITVHVYKINGDWMLSPDDYYTFLRNIDSRFSRLYSNLSSYISYFR